MTLGTATVKMDRLSNRYCEGGSTTWNGYCDFNKGVIQHLKDPKTGDEYFEVKLNEPVRLILKGVKLHLLHWHCYCNRVERVNCGYPWNLMRKTYVIYWSRFKRVSRVNLEGHHGVGKRFHGTVCSCFSQESPEN